MNSAIANEGMKLFENKAHHTTYFGTNLEYIQGLVLSYRLFQLTFTDYLTTLRIHMLPLLPSSAYTRNETFVKQEWDAMFAQGACSPASNVSSGGWKGVLYANQAIIDPAAAYDFFNQPNFNMAWIDGGATRTWYLAYAAGKLIPLLLHDMWDLTNGLAGLKGGN